jgi:LPS export ABC transporter protein LptC
MNHREIERWYRLRNIKKASQVLVVVCVVMLAAGYGTSRLLREDTEKFVPPPETASGSRIDNFTYSSPGSNPWELAATTAVVSDSLDSVALSNPRVVYHGGKGGRILLSARTGTLDRRKRHVSAAGDVRIEYKDYRFSTGEITYSDETRLAETKEPVCVEGGDFQVSGSGLTVSVDREEIVIEQDVKARLNDPQPMTPPCKVSM